MPNELRDKIVEWLFNETTLLDVECEAAGDGIMSLIDAERCVWTYDSEREWVTSCGNEVLDEATYGQYPFCPCCGKRIEVKDE